jgi:predicted ABC-type ATPase
VALSSVAPPKPPTLYVFAGPNGSGKSTIFAGASSQLPDAAVIVNADVAAQMLRRQRNEGKLDPKTQWDAANFAETLRYYLIECGVSFAIETVLSDFDRWRRLFDHAIGRGYALSLVFVTTSDPAINIERVAKRVAEGGHDVPEDKIVSRYIKTMTVSLPGILPLCTDAILFDNSGKEAVVVARKRAARSLEILRPDCGWAATLTNSL